jgi:hypothetical protein
MLTTGMQEAWQRYYFIEQHYDQYPNAKNPDNPDDKGWECGFLRAAIREMERMHDDQSRD